MLKPGSKRFYQRVSTTPNPPYGVCLDDRPMRTPGGKPQVVPTEALARAMAAEWDAQGDQLDLSAMHLTKAVNTAIDRIAPRRSEVITELARFAASDLLCYRAQAPRELVQRQAEAWDPWLDWARSQLGLGLKRGSGIVHVEQEPSTLPTAMAAIERFDDFALTALHPAITITGSAVLGLAFGMGLVDASRALALSHLDEDYQAEQWGPDAEALAVRKNRLAELELAARILALLKA